MATFGHIDQMQSLCGISMAPFALGANAERTEDDCPNRTQHQHKRDTPGYIGVLVFLLWSAEFMSELLDGQGHSEEVESVPAPAEKCDEEEHPLLQIEKSEQLERIGRFAHWWLQSWNASGNVGADGHLLRRLMVIARR